MNDIVNAVEAEVVKETDIIKANVVVDTDKVKASILAQKANFQAQLEAARKELARLQQEFDRVKNLGVKLEGALESLELLLKGFTPSSK